MGCDLNISIVTNTGNPQKYFELCFSELQKYESVFSRFNKKSELSLLNKEKKRKVSSLFLKVFSKAKRLFNTSKGIFNPLSQIEQFGYISDFSHKSSFQKNSKIHYDDDFSKIIVNEKNRIIQLQENQKLDFGGFLKGYCAQKISKKLDHFHGSIINIGGDIYAQGYGEDNEEFTCSIYNPLNKKDIFNIPLKNMSLSTSGTYKRHWQSDGKIVSHIIDTQKKESTQSNIISASIIGNDGSESDAWATLAIILGSEKAQEFLNKKNKKYILITKNGNIIHNLPTSL